MFLGSALVASLMTQSPIPAASLIRNPSFESGLSGWAAYQGTAVAVVQSGAPHGAFVAKLAAGASGGLFTLNTVPIFARARAEGATYRARVYVAAAAATSVGKSAFVALRERDAKGAIVAVTESNYLALQAAFAPVDVSASAHAAGNSLEVYVAHLNGAAGDALALDLATLTEDVAPALEDAGSTPWAKDPAVQAPLGCHSTGAPQVVGLLWCTAWATRLGRTRRRASTPST